MGNMKYRRQIWDSVARDYDVIWKAADYTPILRSIVEEAKIDSGKKVLDVATGTGMVGIEVAKKVGENGFVLGIDLSKRMLKQAMKKKKVQNVDKIDFILADAHTLPLRDEHFDAVTSCFAFAFLSNPLRAADEMARVLRTGGRLVSAEWERPPLGFWAETRKKGGIHDFLESELVKILHNSGLRKIRTERIQILHRRPNVSDELIEKSQLLSVRLTGLKESDAKWFFSKIREEYQKLPQKNRGWLPILYVGVKS
jgi:ubiquinone/menaquinone biosynthesis C-methylase UbiE